MQRRGFTLIELLVVIAIIGILAGIIIATWGPVHQQARDTKRVSDISQVQVGLEGYFEDLANANQYPTSLTTLQTSGYLASVPTDPTTGVAYDYSPCNSSSCSDSGKYDAYCLGANLENLNEQSGAVSAGQSSCNGVTWCPYTSTTYGYTNTGPGSTHDNYVVCRQ